MKSAIRFATLLILTTTLSSCVVGRALAPEEIVKHPDAPMLILEVKGHYARVAVYDRNQNQMIEFGWVDLEENVGWTLHKFDWEKHVRDRTEN